MTCKGYLQFGDDLSKGLLSRLKSWGMNSGGLQLK